MNGETDAVVASIKAMASTLASRIESTEKDFIGHLRKVEDRLDILVDLTKTVAVLQNQTSQYVSRLDELQSQIREMSNRCDNGVASLQQKTDTSISRLHDRIDETNTIVRDRIEIFGKNADVKHGKQDDRHDMLASKVDGWISWGRGAYAIGALFFAFVTWTGLRWLDDLDKRTQTVVQVKQDVMLLETRVSTLISNVQEHMKLEKDK